MFSFLNKKSSKKAQNEPKSELNTDIQFGSLRIKPKKKSKQPQNDSEKSNKKNSSYFSTGYFTTGRLSKKKCSNSLGLCYLIYGPETKRTLLPSQVTGIDTVKALFVRAFSDKLTMSYLDDERSVKIYIKDQTKDLFYQLDDINDIKDKCVLKLTDISNGTTKSQVTPVVESNSHMTQSQYCYSSLSEHQSASIQDANAEKAPICARSLSEPRIQQGKKNSTPKQTYQNPIYNQASQEYILTNQDLMNQTINSASTNVETYDNLDAQSAHQSRIESKYVLPNPLNYYDRYNRSLNPIYNSMRINSRDVKSMDRDVLYSYQNGAATPRKSEPHTPQLSRQSTINEHSFAQSPTKVKIDGTEIDVTEDDTISLPSSISIRGFKNFQTDFSKNLDLTECDVECDDDDDEKTVNEENIMDKCEDSKVKMKLMQKQLEMLSNLVHQALINKDLNRLEGIAQTAKFNQTKYLPTNVNKSDLSLINNQAKQLKNDLNQIKKMHENFNLFVGESFREFVNQINNKLKGFYANEQSQNSSIDCLMNKYNADFSKIENELCDLEIVVDDLRENILKHKYKVNIDDVECYALALSQLSKQLVNLKTSFSSIKEYKKKNSSNASNRLAILPKNSTVKKPHNPPGLPPMVKNSSSSQENICYVNMDESQSIKSEHEQQKLTIEVDTAFNQLMSEISMIAHDLNPNKTFKNCLTIENFKIENESLETDSFVFKHESKLDTESSMNKRSKFRAQRNKTKSDQDSSINSSTSSNSSFGSTPSSPTYFSSNSSPLPLVSSHLNGINIQTMPIPLPVPLSTQYVQNKSYLETVQEEESTAVLDTEENQISLDLSLQNMSEEEMLNSVENQLYEQLSQFKPVKKSYKTSASICLKNEEKNEQIEKSNVSTSMVITPNNKLNEDRNETQFSNGKNSKLGVRFSDPGPMKAVKSKIITNGSMQRVSLNKNEQNDLEKKSSSLINGCIYENNKKIDDQNMCCEPSNKTSMLSTVLIQKRNSESSKNSICSNVMGSSTSSIASCSSSTPRRVSLSVTDL